MEKLQIVLLKEVSIEVKMRATRIKNVALISTRSSLGHDLPPDEKYMGSTVANYKHPSEMKDESAAEIVGVRVEKPVFKRTIPAATKAKFYGVENDLADKNTETGDYKKNAARFFGHDPNAETTYGGGAVSNESYEDAQNKFFSGDQDHTHDARQLGDPLPGYSGVCRRVNADNIFGMTYAEARRRGQKSQADIEDQQATNVHDSSKWSSPFKK